MFQIVCKLGFSVKLTEERYFHIITRHPEILDKEDKIKEAVSNPDFIKGSKFDSNVALFYKSVAKDYIVVVVKKTGYDGFVITAYLTDFVKEGDIIWKK